MNMKKEKITTFQRNLRILDDTMDEVSSIVLNHPNRKITRAQVLDTLGRIQGFCRGAVLRSMKEYVADQIKKQRVYNKKSKESKKVLDAKLEALIAMREDVKKETALYEKSLTS